MRNIADLEIQGGGSPRMTARSGHVLLDEVIREGGICESARAPALAPGSGHSYPSEIILVTLLHLLLAGGKTLSDIRVLRRDGLWGDIRLPSADALGAWLARTGTEEGLAALGTVHGNFLSRCMGPPPAEGHTLDIDDTYIPCKKKASKKSYKGELGFCVTTCFVAGDGWLLHERHCDGNHRAGANLADVFGEAVGRLPTGHRYGLVRSDSAGFGKDFIARVDDYGAGFVIAGRRNSAVCAAADSLSKRAWKRLGKRKKKRGDSLLVAETTYSFRGDDRSFRLVFVRRRTKGQMSLLASQELVGVYATNLDVPAEEVTKIYRKRADCENRIKEYKSDLAAGRPPCSLKAPNAVWARVNAIAYNVAALFRKLLFRHERHGVATIRWKVLQIAGTVVCHARRWILRVTNEHAQSLRNWRELLAF